MILNDRNNVGSWPETSFDDQYMPADQQTPSTGGSAFHYLRSSLPHHKDTDGAKDDLDKRVDRDSLAESSGHGASLRSSCTNRMSQLMSKLRPNKTNGSGLQSVED